MTSSKPAYDLLTVDRLSISFGSGTRALPVLDGVSFALARGEALALVGESGSGKSVTALSLLRLLPPSARVTDGRATFKGENLLRVPEARMRQLRGAGLALVLQNPARALNPTRRVGHQVADVILAHRRGPRRLAEIEADALLARVGLGGRTAAYPFELSGGSCQRVMIALAAAAAPALLIADEPTSGLDVTTQRMILDLIGDLARERDLAMLLITHDLALAVERCQRIAVMHAGQIVEVAPARPFQPWHPYTVALLRATPRPGMTLAALAAIPGTLPNLGRSDLPACRFHDRCSRRMPICASATPPLRDVAPGHVVACHAEGPSA
jgi:peptide/nickel transport system ATP-binding protein